MWKCITERPVGLKHIFGVEESEKWWEGKEAKTKTEPAKEKVLDYRLSGTCQWKGLLLL